MKSLLGKMIRSSIGLCYHELYCIACCVVGLAKVRLFFDPSRDNKLEIGAGLSRKEGFLILDLNLAAQFPYDLRAGLPFPDASIDFLYAEHVLEHLQHREVAVLLKECDRVLRPGGVISVCVPDAAAYLEGYAHAPLRPLQPPDSPLNFEARINYVNYMFYMDGHHKFMFDQEGLLLALQDAGFNQVRPRSFDPSLDWSERRAESIYAEGTKRQPQTDLAPREVGR